MSKRQEFCLALHHLALTFFVIYALPLWYLTGILSDVPPDVSADALHAGRRQLAILFAVFTVIFLIGMIVYTAYLVEICVMIGQILLMKAG